MVSFRLWKIGASLFIGTLANGSKHALQRFEKPLETQLQKILHILL
jgi:hypothetical protein